MGLCCLPKVGAGRPRADDRKTINGILYVLIASCRWMDMSAVCGSYKTCWRRPMRELIGHGECVMQLTDSSPSGLEYVDENFLKHVEKRYSI